MTTEIIVETKYDTIIVDDSQDTILVEISGEVTVITEAAQGVPGPRGPSGLGILSELLDVDSTNKIEGSILVYSTQAQKWVATTQLENQIIESGQY